MDKYPSCVFSQEHDSGGHGNDGLSMSQDVLSCYVLTKRERVYTPVDGFSSLYSIILLRGLFRVSDSTFSPNTFPHCFERESGIVHFSTEYVI